MMTNLDSKVDLIKVSSPSNIAFIKYWGKHGYQLPINPSISMTLRNCVSVFEIAFVKRVDDPIAEFTFESKKNLTFKKRLNEFLNNIKDSLPILVNFSLNIKCMNTFPHSSGIASSASAMSAIVYGLLRFNSDSELDEKQLQLASNLARLGSGSACRSMFSGVVHWGLSSLKDSSDEYAKSLDGINPIFRTLRDSVLIIDNAKKKFSSTYGHSLMMNHPFKNARVKQANDNYDELIVALRSGDTKTFGRIIENEALSLHGLMMTSNPAMILLHPNSLRAIDLVHKFREESGADLYFTIDAGANIHLIYFEKDSLDITKFIQNSLSSLCMDNQVIHDEYGSGPKTLAISKKIISND